MEHQPNSLSDHEGDGPEKTFDERLEEILLRRNAPMLVASMQLRRPSPPPMQPETPEVMPEGQAAEKPSEEKKKKKSKMTKAKIPKSDTGKIKKRGG